MSRSPPGHRPRALPAHASPQGGLLELDRFNSAGLRQWKALSSDLDELHASLFFDTQPERRRLRDELLAALSGQPRHVATFDGWSRLVTYEFSMQPLSAAGSLTGAGGRFNPGLDLDEGTLQPYPAFYLASDHETAFREKFQLASTDRVGPGGLTPQELALGTKVSFASIALRGEVRNVFDMTGAAPLAALARVLARIRMPQRALVLRRKLRIASAGPDGVFMVRTAAHVFESCLKANWRWMPMQFGLPAPSQIVGELIRAAGFEAIQYRSTKAQGLCLAVFPDKITSSHIELVDASPAGVRHTRLDQASGDELAGWETLARRPRR